jgi:hypothetical protein
MWEEADEQTQNSSVRTSHNQPPYPLTGAKLKAQEKREKQDMEAYRKKWGVYPYESPKP